MSFLQERQQFLTKWINDDGLQEVLSQQNNEIFQEESPREISLIQEDNEQELDDEISSLDSLLIWLELRTLDWIKQQRDNLLTERIEPIHSRNG